MVFYLKIMIKFLLINQYLKFKNLSVKEAMNKKINLKKFSKKFSIFQHFQNLEKILSN